MKFTKTQIIYFGLVFHLLAAFFSIGYHQCDELFQVFEFAGYKLGINPAVSLPWEFTEQMRSGIQPFIVYIFTKTLHLIGIMNPFTISFFVRLFQSIISFIALVRFLKLFEKELIAEQLKKWLWIFGLLFWCMPYFHARFSSENFSATLFLLGLVIALESSSKRLDFLYFFIAGLLMGLAFHTRFQTIFMIAGFFAWLIFVNRSNLKNLFFLIIGFSLSLGIGLIADKWLYGNWTLSWINYLDQNLFENKASYFGKQPFYFYIGEALLQTIPPFSLIIVFCILGFWLKFRGHLITWITLPFILIHFFVSHKELRFFFPVINFLPIILLLFFQFMQHSKNKLWNFIKRPGFVKFAIVVNVILLIFFTFKPADNNSHSLKIIYETVQGERPVLIYEGNNPYNHNASLNYFRNAKIITLNVDSSALLPHKTELYYFSEKFNDPELLVKDSIKFQKIYSNYPPWISYFNFNGWVDRSVTFSIYKSIQ